MVAVLRFRLHQLSDVYKPYFQLSVEQLARRPDCTSSKTAQSTASNQLFQLQWSSLWVHCRCITALFLRDFDHVFRFDTGFSDHDRSSCLLRSQHLLSRPFHTSFAADFEYVRVGLFATPLRANLFRNKDDRLMENSASSWWRSSRYTTQEGCKVYIRQT